MTPTTQGVPPQRRPPGGGVPGGVPGGQSYRDPPHDTPPTTRPPPWRRRHLPWDTWAAASLILVIDRGPQPPTDERPPRTTCHLCGRHVPLTGTALRPYHNGHYTRRIRQCWPQCDTP